MDKILQIYTATDNKGGVQNFPYIDEEPLRIVDFSFSGSRMEIPTLTASVKHKECLDSKWNYKQFIEFRGEKYWVSKIPSSSKDNTDHRYKHDITFVSERNILSNIYFYDIVDAESESGKYHSNSSKVLFYGTISELVDRINASLKYSGVDYVVAIKEGEIPADKLAVTKEFSCENVFVFDALKQAFETWDIPFYFVGKNCYFGFGEELEKDSLKYGKNNGLLKIERTNGNTRIITRATGLGSTENIPFYYPNMSEKGDFTFTLKRKDGTIIPVEIIDQNKVATTIPDGVTYEFTDESEYSNAYINTIVVQTAYGEPWKGFFLLGYSVNVSLHDDPHSIRVWFTVDNFDNVIFDFRLNTENHGHFQLKDFKSISLYDAETNQPIQTWFGLNTSKITTDFKNGLSGSYYFLLSELDIFRGGDIIDEEYQYTFETVTISTVTSKEETTKIYKWIPKDVDNARNFTSLKYLGIDYVETEADLEGTFVMNIIPNSKVPYQERLMPSIFSRGTAFNGNVTATRGVERFYDAKNNTYPNIKFTNELNEFNRSENIYQYDDIKPSIAKVTNANGELIGQVLDVAFDKNDNDDVYGEEYGDKSNNYIHPYFYIKLHTFDGDLGFNLFNRATEKDSMTIQMTSGDLNGCKFKIQVIDKGNNVFANPVQVYTQADVDKGGSTITEDMIGQIVAGDSDKKISRSNFIESQQDTRKNEVWIAVLKDTDTFGTILPSSVTNLVVKRGDTFNITGIHMPESYILAAEQWLDESIVSDMADENIEAFNFAIDFSRIFLQEDYETNKENSWVAKLTESVRIPVEYNGRAYQQYVTSYTYECKGAELLPKISVGLSNTIAKSESYADAIVKKSTTTITQSTPRIVKTQIANSNLAVKSNTLSGYGITDAKIEDDGTLVLGTASVVIPKETKSLDWSQITNKPDYFELDENGDIKVKDGKGFWSESFISTKGKSDNTNEGGAGLNIEQLWNELGRVDDSKKIDYSHMPEKVITATNWALSVYKADTDAVIDTWEEIVNFLNGIENTTLKGILDTKANKASVDSLNSSLTSLSNAVNTLKDKTISTGQGLKSSGTLSTGVTISLDLSASDIPNIEQTQVNGLSTTLEGFDNRIIACVDESEFATFFANEMAKWFIKDADGKALKPVNGMAFYSESYISTKGLSIENGTSSGAGLNITQLWEELRNVATDNTEIIHITHLPALLQGITSTDISNWDSAYSFVASITGTDSDTVINKWNEIVSFLSGISDTSSLSSILSGKANASVVEELSDDVSALNSHITNILARKVNAGTGLTGGGTLNADVTLSLATIGTAGTYTKVVVDAYGRVTGNSALLASDIPQLEMGQINGLVNELEAYSQLIESSVQESEFAAFFAQEMAKWFVLDSENKGIKTANGYGFYSESYISSKGLSDDTTGGSGIDVSSLWAELADDGTEQIAKNHLVDALNGYATQSWVTSQNYLTEITKSSIISALGYTPFNASNFTKSNIQSTLGISDWALASTKPSYAFSEITGKPTTLSGYGVTDAIPYKETRVEIKTSAVGYGYQEAGFPAAGGFITAVHHGGNYGFALYGTNNNEGLFYRGLLGGVWNDTWKKIAFTDGHVKSASGVYINNSTASDIFPLVFVDTGSCGNPRIDSLYVDAVKGAGYNPSTKSFHANTFVGYLNGTANNADMLDGVHLADVYRKSGWYRVVPYINNGGIVYHYWFKVAQINYTTTSGLAELELAAVSDANYMYSASARLTIKGYSGNPSCSVSLTSNAYLSTRINVALDKDGGVWVKSNCSWSSYLRWRAIVNDEGYTGITILDGSTKQLDQPINSCVIEENTGATYRQSKDAFETAWAAFDVGIGSFKSYSAQIKILPYNDSAYIEFGNADFTNNVPAFITGYSSNPLNLLTISSHSTIFTGSVTIGGANGVTLSFDATNDMLKFSKGGYFLGAVSTKGVSNDTSGGTGGIDLSAMWNSLSNNTDTFGSIKIHIDHIPTITKSKIRDFPTLVSAFANDAGYITTSAIVNKADKATTLAGYGITDAVTLNTNQTITGLKTFKNAEYYTAIINSTLEDGEVRLILQNNNIPKVLIGYDSLGSFFYDYGSAQTLRIQNDGHLIYTSFIDAQNDISTTGWFVNKQLNKGLYNEAGQQRWYYRSDENQKGWYSTTDIIAANQLVSVLGTGTAPLKVYSTTMVSNLNANYLGGLNKDNFQKAIYDYINTSGVANTTDLPTILAPSNYNGVNSLGGNFKFYDTKFFSSQANTSNRCQLAYGYDVDSIHFRRYNDGNWGGWKEIAFIDSLVEKASGLKVDNNRDVNELPYSYGTEQVNWRFKVNSAIGLTGAGGSYSGVLHLTPWGGKTGGPDHQLAFGYNGGIFHRYGLTNWGDWRKLAFTEGTDNLKVTNASARFTANNGTTSLFYGFGNGSVNRGIWDNSINNWILGTDGANIFMLGANVGVNTTTPAYNFDVNGTTRTNYLRVGNDVTINGDANISSMIMTRNDSGVLSLDGNYIDVYAPMNVHTRLKVGEATISWDSVNGMLKVDKGAYFTGPVSSKGVSNDTSGMMATAQFGVEWNESWTIDSNEVTSLGNVSSASISASQGSTNGSSIYIVCDAFTGKKVSDIEIFTLGWEGEYPADARLVPYKIVGNELSCKLYLTGTMTPILFKIKIY